MDNYLNYLNLYNASISVALKPCINSADVFSDDMYYLEALINRQLKMGKTHRLSGKDFACIAQIKEGGTERERAMSRLFQRHKHFVHRGIGRFNLTEIEAQEVFMDSLLALISAIEQERFMGDSKISTYLFRIFENKAKNKVRDRKQEELTHSWIEDIPDMPERARNILQEMVREEEMDWLATLLDKMGSRCRDILIMQEFEGYTQEEIANKLGLKNDRAVSTSRYRCLRKLKEFLSRSNQINLRNRKNHE